MTDENAALLDQKGVVRAYVEGTLEEQTERPVRERTTFFAPAAVAARNLPRDMSKALGHYVGNELAEELRQEKLYMPLIDLKNFLESKRERFADYGFSIRFEPCGERTLGGRRGIQLIATNRDRTESYTLSLEVGVGNLGPVTILVDGNRDPRGGGIGVSREVGQHLWGPSFAPG